MSVTGYKPQQRDAACRVLTRAGWLTGTFHVPEKSGLLEFLCRATEFYRMTDVGMPGRFDHRPFFAMQRDAMLVVIPSDDETRLQSRTETEAVDRHSVSCLLEVGMVDGTIETLKGVRLSDFLAQRRDFVVLQDASFALGPPGAPAVPLAQRASRALVNAAAILGISEV